MWRLSTPFHDESRDRGVTTILVVILMPILLMFGAFVVDGGRGILARRQTQNAADAGALAKATDCARGVSSTNFDPYQTNGAVLANSPTCGSGVTTVTMSRDITFVLRPDLRGGTATITRSATARWGTLSAGNTAPVVISQCSFDLATANGTTFPSAEVIIPLGGGGEECPGAPPGAFGWLDQGLTGPCSVPTTLNENGQLLVHGNTGTGNVNPWDCITQVSVGGQLMIPIYVAACRDPSPCVAEQNDGVGDNTYYLILGYAVLEITGWDLQHGSPKRSADPPTCPGTGSTSCLSGRFVRFERQVGGTGPGTNFGGTYVYLSLN